jgi:phosphoglucomutase
MLRPLLLLHAVAAFSSPLGRRAGRSALRVRVGGGAVATAPIEGMRPGTSGLRKRTSVWVETPNYVENFAQAIVEGWRSVGGFPAPGGGTLVLGGDGRYFNDAALQRILRVLAGNGVAKVVVPVGGVLSTPAASALVRRLGADGAILLTASHNPGGPDGDFGVKFNTGPDGAPAKEFLTEAVYEASSELTSFNAAEAPDVDLAAPGTFAVGDTAVEVVESSDAYVAALKECFDFDKLKAFIAEKKPNLFLDAMHGAAGPAATRVFVDELGVDPAMLYRCDPRPDFGGAHPDPNLKWADELVKRVGLEPDGSPMKDRPEHRVDFGVAFDGDGDRNMIVGDAFFVSPSDSLAVLAANAKSVKWFADRGGLAACARSMPTSRALDRVAAKQGIECFETPTGWKFFGNLMELKQPFLCGEESFGTGADHVREKDGLWAALAWMSVLADANAGSDELVGVADVVKAHWRTYGRDLYCRHDYDECASEGANAMMARLGELCGAAKSDLAALDPGLEGVESFSFVDPLDNSETTNQGMILSFDGGGRCVFRLSGTGSAGATIRVYVEKPLPEPSEADLDLVAADALGDLADAGKKVADLVAFSGRESPSVIT